MFLAVLSSSRQFPISGDNGVFSIIDAILRKRDSSESNWNYWDWLHSMEDIGFVHIDRDNGKVQVEPCFLARSTSSENEAFLSGARTPSFLSELYVIATKLGIKIVSKSVNPFFPQRIKLIGVENSLINLATQLKIKISPLPLAYQLAVAAPAVSAIFEQWRFNDIVLEGNIIPEEEGGIRFFNPQNLRYDGAPPSISTPYVLGMRKKFGRHFNMYCCKDDNYFQVSTDVSVGYAKWFCFVHSGAKLLYNKVRQTVVIPKHCRLPAVLGRSLALCCCTPPKELSRAPFYGEYKYIGSSFDKYLEYEKVPEVIANIIADKLETVVQLVEFPEDRLLCKTR